MSFNPFQADPSIAERQAALSASVGDALSAELRSLLAGRHGNPDANLGSVLLRGEVEALCARFQLTGARELMLLALTVARDFARPPISDFFVGALGLEADTGNLIFGGNLEFPGTHLGTAVHGEGFVATRSFSRGTRLEAIAIGEAHPCAHCRQYLTEFSWAPDLHLLDPLGHDLALAQLYPWPFDPAYLNEAGAGSVEERWPLLRFSAEPPEEPALRSRLLSAGRRAHTPYSRCPSAVVLGLADGSMVSGAAIESVAFNPGMGPLQAAVIDLLAHGYSYRDISSASLGTVVGGDVDMTRSVAELLAAIAPGAKLEVFGWQAE